MESIEKLESIAKQIRRDIVEMVYKAKSGHPGGSLSCADILTVLYFNEMNINLSEPKMQNRDRFVLSKGHCSPALYATLANRGFFFFFFLARFRKIDSNLQGHPDLNRVYCLLGDGEIQEGQVWEAAMTATHYKLDNLCVIVDNNNLQIDGTVSDVMNIYPIDKKFESFGFEVINIDGNNIEEIIKAFEQARKITGKPTAIIAKTKKGKGVSFMEDNAKWHGKAPNQEEYEQAMKELV